MSPKNHLAPAAPRVCVTGTIVTFTGTLAVALTGPQRLSRTKTEPDALTAAAAAIRSWMITYAGPHMAWSDNKLADDRAYLAGVTEDTAALARTVLTELDTLSTTGYDGRTEASRRRRARTRDLEHTARELMTEARHWLTEAADPEFYLEDLPVGITADDDPSTASLVIDTLAGLIAQLTAILTALTEATEAARASRLDTARRAAAFALTILAGTFRPPATPRPPLIASLTAAPAAPPTGWLLSRDLDASRV